LIQTTLPDGEIMNQALCWATGTNVAYVGYSYATAGGHPEQRVAYDILGREVAKQVTGFGSSPLLQKVTYDSKGNIISQTDPYYASETPITTTKTYDE
jgi:hypothetical protein